MRVVAGELERLQEEPATEAELERAKDDVKGRIVLSLEATATRMNRLGASVLNRVELESIDEVLERVDSVTLDDLRELVGGVWAPRALSAAGIGPDEEAFRAALEPLSVGVAA